MEFLLAVFSSAKGSGTKVGLSLILPYSFSSKDFRFRLVQTNYQAISDVNRRGEQDHLTYNPNILKAY
jgi:hypothetical protein